MISLPIASAHNPNFKRWKSLIDSAGIREHGQFLIFGGKVIPELLAKVRGSVELILPPSHLDDHLPYEELSPYLVPSAAHRVRVYQLTERLFKGLDTFGTGYPIVCLRTPQIETWSASAKIQELHVVLATQDPSNLGAALRSCAAFGIRNIILSEECASPFLPRATRAASGTSVGLHYYRGGKLSDIVRSDDATAAIPMFGLDMDGESVATFSWPSRGILVLGEEGRGLPKEFSGSRLSIPIAPQAESLNATNALSVALYSYRLRHPLQRSRL